MDLVKTKRILEIMKGVNITEAGIFAEGDEKNQIRGITEDKMIIMFTDVDRFIDTGVGILSVKGLLSRLTLFNEEKMGVDLKTKDSKKTGDTYVNQIIVKEGRRRSNVTTTDPNMMAVPTKYPDSERVFTAGFTKEYIDYINKMKASVTTSSSSETTLYAELHFNPDSDGSAVDFSIGGGYDDFDDSIEAEVEEKFVGKNFSVQWKIDPFIRAMKQASTTVENDEFIVTVNTMGILEIDMEGVVVSVAPMNVTQPE